ETWIEQRIVGDEIAADDVGLRAAAAVAHDGKRRPRRGSHERRDRRDLVAEGSTVHDVPVTIGEHDDIAGLCGSALALVEDDRAAAGGDDVEEGQTVAAR